MIHHATKEELAEWEMQEASAELVAAEAEFDRLSRAKHVTVEAWDALERRYECDKKLWLMFVGEDRSVRMNEMYNEYRRRLLSNRAPEAWR